MSLAAGTRLGPYEVADLIGAGGMGEVYRARESRLGREVAIKVSTAQFTDRIEREARAIAQLNHPHLCQIYDVGPDYLVMECVDGAPLAGPLPVAKAVEYAVLGRASVRAASDDGMLRELASGRRAETALMRRLRRDAPADLGAPGPDRLMDHGGTRPSGQRGGATRERCPRGVEAVGRPPQFGPPLRVS